MSIGSGSDAAMNPTSSSTSSRAVGSSNTSSNNWRNPSESQREKYNLREWPADDVLTLEEEQLLEMYEVIRQHERVAARLKEEAARAKLAAADAEFHQKQQRLASNDQKKHKRRKRVKQKLADNEGNTDSDDNDDDDDLDDDVNDSAKQDDDDDDVVYSDDEDNLHARREAKLSQLRMEVAQAQQQQAGDSTFLDQKQENDKMRSHYPAVTEAVDDGPLLKRKLRRDILDPDFSTTEPSSLIANMTEAATPPHEFSKKLELIKTGGKVLFPESSGNSNTSSLDVFKWEPPSNAETPNDGAFEAKLNDFDMELAQNGLGNNTVAIKFMAPATSKRFSINITTADNDSFTEDLFHFNPRQFERQGQLILNDRQDSIWGQALAIPLSQIPLMFGQVACTLMIQINDEGFDIFLEGQHSGRLEHRKEFPTGNTNLVLQFPSTNDYGDREDWVVYKVWWGNRPIMAKDEVSDVYGVNSFNADHPRKIFIRDLPRIYSEIEVEERKGGLERVFRKYGGDRGVTVIAPTNATYAFIEMESESMTDLALREMGNMYGMNRARWTRHEALKEKRAAAQAVAGGGVERKGGTWD